ncbi:MAG: sensor histidine kinase [Motilibacteraceae bacterium]
MSAASAPSVLERMPAWTRTLRFRLTVSYSALVFAATALVLAAIYLGLHARLSGNPVTNTVTLQRGFFTADGTFVPLGSVTLTDVRSLEQAVNERTLEALRTYSVWTLLTLLVVSLAVGWWLSGRALRPVAAMAATAEEITATDLSRRIALQGPDDELRRLGDTIDGMLARLEDSFAAQRRIVDDASHELRTPLAIIRANVDAVLAADDATPAERARAAEVVGRACERMSRLVDDLLATARRAGGRFVEPELDLGAVAREALEEVRPLAPDAVLRSGLADGVVVTGDRDALRRAVANLLSNATRYSPAGREVLCASGRLGDWAWVAVRDEGPGIAREHQARLFERFFRVEGHGASGHAGLGLAIVRQIVESHGGAVAVHSEPGRGATFVLWLPVAHPSGEALPVPVTTDPLPGG